MFQTTYEYISLSKRELITNLTPLTMNKNILLTAGVLFATALSSVLMATPIPPDPDIVPIDGGLSLLVAACAGYGAKKIYDVRKEKKASK
jgi:hypothetical protein